MNPGIPSTREAAALPSALLLIPLQLAAENLRAALEGSHAWPQNSLPSLLFSI